MKFNRWFSVAAAALLTVLSVDANAQKIRNYAPEEAPAAAPAPAKAPAAAASTAQPSGEGDGEGGVTVENSYAIQMSGSAGPTTSSKTSKTLDLKPEELYRGVIPGTRDQVDHLATARKRGESSTNRLLWIGFQPRENSTRVFLQFSREAEYQVGTGENGEIVVTLSNTKLSEKNFARFMDTSYFNRNVQRVTAKKSGRNEVQVTITLAKNERPQVNSTESYVYLEFSGEEHKKKEEKSEEASGSSQGDGNYGAMDE